MRSPAGGCLVGHLVALAGVAAVTLALHGLKGRVADSILMLTLLVVVFFVATGWGVGPSRLAAVSALLCIDFYAVPPRESFAVGNLEGWAALAAFATAATIIGQLAARAAEAEREIGLRARLQAALAELGARALQCGPADGFLDVAASLVARTLRLELAAIEEHAPASGDFLLRAGTGFQPGLVGVARLEGSKDTQAGSALRSGHPLVVEDLGSAALFKGPGLLERHGVQSGVTTPISTGAGPYGVLAVHSVCPREYSLEEQYFLQAAANVIGSCIERSRAEESLRGLNAELEARVASRTSELSAANGLKDELIAREQAALAKLQEARLREGEIGSRIQQMLLLDHPPIDLPGLRVAALSVPSRQIDGDFYLFFRHGDHRLDVLVADVMGKGVPAALLAAATRSHLMEARSRLLERASPGEAPEPREIVALAHASMAPHLIRLESFVTLGYVRLDLEARTLTLVDCGHTGLLHWHAAEAATTMLHGENLPLGAREGELFEQVESRFAPGDVLVLFSDGVTDARDPGGERFGLERLVRCVEAGKGLDAARLVASIREAAEAFAGRGPLEDDLTCVVMVAGESEVPLARAEAELSSDLAELTRARSLVRSTCAGPAPPVDDATVASLELAITEACSNVMRHAYHGRPDQRIQLEVEVFVRHVAVRLRHRGDPFRPPAPAPPAVDSGRESGFGLFLITRSVDEVRYFLDAEGRNCIALVKARPEGSPKGAPSPSRQPGDRGAGPPDSGSPKGAPSPSRQPGERGAGPPDSGSPKGAPSPSRQPGDRGAGPPDSESPKGSPGSNLAL